MSYNQKQSKQSKKLLAIVQLDVGQNDNGENSVIKVYEGDDLYQLTYQFCLKNDLSEDCIEYLVQNIKQQIQIHKSKKNSLQNSIQSSNQSQNSFSNQYQQQQQFNDLVQHQLIDNISTVKKPKDTISSQNQLTESSPEQNFNNENMFLQQKIQQQMLQQKQNQQQQLPYQNQHAVQHLYKNYNQQDQDQNEQDQNQIQQKQKQNIKSQQELELQNQYETWQKRINMKQDKNEQNKNKNISKSPVIKKQQNMNKGKVSKNSFTNLSQQIHKDQLNNSIQLKKLNNKKEISRSTSSNGFLNKNKTKKNSQNTSNNSFQKSQNYQNFNMFDGQNIQNQHEFIIQNNNSNLNTSNSSKISRDNMVYEKLYQNAIQKQQEISQRSILQKEAQQKKEQLEFEQNCSFHPQISPVSQRIQRNQNIEDKLLKEQIIKREKLEIGRQIKEEQERQQCTFQPYVSAQSRQIVQTNPQSERIDSEYGQYFDQKHIDKYLKTNNIHDRLYHQAAFDDIRKEVQQNQQYNQYYPHSPDLGPNKGRKVPEKTQKQFTERLFQEKKDLDARIEKQRFIENLPIDKQTGQKLYHPKINKNDPVYKKVSKRVDQYDKDYTKKLKTLDISSDLIHEQNGTPRPYKKSWDALLRTQQSPLNYPNTHQNLNKKNQQRTRSMTPTHSPLSKNTKNQKQKKMSQTPMAKTQKQNKIQFQQNQQQYNQLQGPQYQYQQQYNQPLYNVNQQFSGHPFGQNNTLNISITNNSNNNSNNNSRIEISPKMNSARQLFNNNNNNNQDQKQQQNKNNVIINNSSNENILNQSPNFKKQIINDQNNNFIPGDSPNLNKHLQKIKMSSNKKRMRGMPNNLLIVSFDTIQPHVREQLRRLFNGLDSDGDGKISANLIDLSNIKSEELEVIQDVLFEMEDEQYILDFNKFLEKLIQKDLVKEMLKLYNVMPEWDLGQEPQKSDFTIKSELMDKTLEQNQKKEQKQNNINQVLENNLQGIQQYQNMDGYLTDRQKQVIDKSKNDSQSQSFMSVRYQKIYQQAQGEQDFSQY